jgi:hypothetical protein
MTSGPEIDTTLNTYAMLQKLAVMLISRVEVELL